MRYLHKAFKAKKGNKVTAHIDQPTRVLLLSHNQYRKYKDSKSFSYRGGHTEGKSVEFEIPETGTWHIVIERGSYFKPKMINASIELSKEEA